MCGISGIVDLRDKGLSLSRLQTMNDSVIHRGPDDEGLVLFTRDGDVCTSSDAREVRDGVYHVGIAHRRLSIIDLSKKGHQPMFDQTRRYSIVYNGEIYNYKELRDQIASAGYQFTSNTDTEVVLAAYVMWGHNCLQRFNGMWAFAIFDRVNKTLFCSRDHFGIKPFYYASGKGFFVFGSEIKQIKHYLEETSGINEGILADFLFWGHETHSRETFFRKIYALPPASYLFLDTEKIIADSIEPKLYWQPDIESEIDDDQAIDRFRDLFFDSVNLRLRSDVPVGTTLSGGLDSSSVACAMFDLLNGGNGKTIPKMFTSVYPDPGYSEKIYADAVVKKTGFGHICVHPSSEGLQKEWSKIIWHMDEPFGNLSYYSNWKVYEMCRSEHVPVILNGQGGDELLLGYERYRAAYLNTLLKKGKIIKLLNEVPKIKKHANMPFVKQALFQIYFTLPGVQTLRKRLLMKPYLKVDFYKTFKNHTESVSEEMSFRTLSELQIKEFFKFQLQHLLHHEDRISMAFSIEARLPFLDYRLFNLVLGLSDSFKLNAGWSKFILRQAMDGCLPDLVKNRTDKMGYDTPSKRLFGDNKKFFLNILEDHVHDDFINTKKVIDDFRHNEIDQNAFCRIITFLSWRKRFSV